MIRCGWCLARSDRRGLDAAGRCHRRRCRRLRRPVPDRCYILDVAAANGALADGAKSYGCTKERARQILLRERDAREMMGYVLRRETRVGHEPV